MKEIILKTTKGQRAQLQPMLDKIKEMALADERGILLAQVHATKIAFSDQRPPRPSGGALFVSPIP